MRGKHKEKQVFIYPARMRTDHVTWYFHPQTTFHRTMSLCHITTISASFHHHTTTMGDNDNDNDSPDNVMIFLLFTYTCLPHVGLSLYLFIMFLLRSLHSTFHHHVFTYTCLPLVFWRMYFIHATYMPILYLSITRHASMVQLYINLSVDLAVSLASL